MRKTVSLVLALLLALAAPAVAAPTVNILSTVTVGGPLGEKVVKGTITFAPADLYVTGGYSFPSGQFGLFGQVVYGVVSQVNGQFTIVPAIVQGAYTLRIQSAISGVANIPATTTTQTVTIPASNTNSPFTLNSVILCQLNNAATGGGGTGTWAAGSASSTCSFASATTFIATSSAAAPTGGGNFVYTLPNNFAEVAAGTPLANVTIPFLIFGN